MPSTHSKAPRTGLNVTRRRAFVYTENDRQIVLRDFGSEIIIIKKIINNVDLIKTF